MPYEQLIAYEIDGMTIVVLTAKSSRPRLRGIRQVIQLVKEQSHFNRPVGLPRSESGSTHAAELGQATNDQGYETTASPPYKSMKKKGLKAKCCLLKEPALLKCSNSKSMSPELDLGHPQVCPRCSRRAMMLMFRCTLEDCLCLSLGASESQSDPGIDAGNLVQLF